ncbi:MAG: DUF429 domain-containing protein [Vampirovibrionales bacterium]|nr:DUF429 domain-containing protein [Vampirovibrionales bacterium]
MSALLATAESQLWGIDFTSAPCKKKPIVSAKASLFDGDLSINDICYWQSLTDFQEFLSQTSQPPWLASVDIPLGMPTQFLEDLQWPTSSWHACLMAIKALPKPQFKETMATFQAEQPTGKKQPKRLCDALAKAQSPTKLHYIPTALMLYEGATRIATASNVSVWPCRVIETSNQRLVEAYPALVLRSISAQHQKKLRPYKSDTQKSDTKPSDDHKCEREWLVNQLTSPGIKSSYGVSLTCSNTIKQAMIEDATGDTLDSVACCIQAAWAYHHWEKLSHYFPNASSVEGWIVDPTLISPPVSTPSPKHKETYL